MILGEETDGRKSLGNAFLVQTQQAAISAEGKEVSLFLRQERRSLLRIRVGMTAQSPHTSPKSLHLLTGGPPA